MRKSAFRAPGFSLVELMVALAIISIGFLGFVGAFSYLSKAISSARYRTIASNLAQEKQEAIKKLSYYRVVVTTAPLHATEVGVTDFAYDSLTFPSETLNVGGTVFIRRTYVEKVQEISGQFTSVAYSQPDTGMKKITVHVLWQQGRTYTDLQARSLYSNPNRQSLNSTIKGTITACVGGANLSGVRVECLQDTSFFSLSDSGGAYSFLAAAGTYTLRGTLFGYYTNYSSSFYVAANSTATQNFCLSQIGTAQISGLTWNTNNQMVISQVVASVYPTVASSTSSSPGEEQEYVEIYNPGPDQVSMCNYPCTTPNYKLKAGNTGSEPNTPYEIKFVYVSTYVAARHYFLFASTPTVSVYNPVSGFVTTHVADAYYDTSPPYENRNGSAPYGGCDDADGIGGGPTNGKDCIKIDSSHGGGVVLTTNGGGMVSDVWVDSVGWCAGGQLTGPSGDTRAPTWSMEGGVSTSVWLNAAGGPGAVYFGTNEQLVRISTLAGTAVNGYARAYDTDYSSTNFKPYYIYSTNALQVRMSTDPVESRLVGKPSLAVASAEDGLSQSTTSVYYYNTLSPFSFGYYKFNLLGVATGTTNVLVADGDRSLFISSVAALTSGTTVYVASAATVGAWEVPMPNPLLTGNLTNYFYNTVFLDSASTMGYIRGTVVDIYGAALSGKTVTAGGINATTSSNGSYFISITSGTYDVTANPTAGPSYDSQYVTSSSQTAWIPSGQVHNGLNFVLSKAGTITGFVTTDGTDPLPNITVNAIGADGYERGIEAVSGSNGYFAISNLSTGTYTVSPQVDPGDSVSPSSASVTLTNAGTAVFSATFTVANAFGTISGTVRTAAGDSIKTGVLIIATTSTISGSNPPVDNSTLRSGNTYYYAASSQADGTYTLPVRGGISAGSPTAYNIYAWYTTVTIAQPGPRQTVSFSTTKKSGTANVVAGGSATVNFTW